MTVNVAALREQYAEDICTCGHRRGAHYAQDGATLGCSSPVLPGGGNPKCSCTAYAWRDAPSRSQRRTLPRDPKDPA